MTTTIDSIKDKFEDLLGEEIVIIVEAGRRKTKTHKGTLTETYPAVFVVELETSIGESYDRVSFSYADVLTESIEIDFPESDVIIIEEDPEEE